MLPPVSDVHETATRSWHQARARQSQTKETHEGKTVIDQVFCPFVRQVVQLRTKHLKIYSTGKRFKLVTKPTEPSKPLSNIKETRLLQSVTPSLKL
ncbi:hypothetical protein Amal_03294 [Acetobacter malorum]|uniref:Uncharacterized protein n=1 Tax=Acetobacter malorum TaxID=178901 RepID=A0A177G6S7_9PROT|nr:hypothetical protein Amal_03294 [Acetobacter malorum]